MLYTFVVSKALHLSKKLINVVGRCISEGALHWALFKQEYSSVGKAILNGPVDKIISTNLIVICHGIMQSLGNMLSAPAIRDSEWSFAEAQQVEEALPHIEVSTIYIESELQGSLEHKDGVAMTIILSVMPLPSTQMCANLLCEGIELRIVMKRQSSFVDVKQVLAAQIKGLN